MNTSQGLFAVLAEPNRRAILDLLLSGEKTATAIVDHLDLAQPTVSKHLKTLRTAGLVTVRPRAQQRLYRLEPTALRALDDWLEPYRRTWAGRLDALESHLEAMPEPSEAPE